MAYSATINAARSRWLHQNGLRSLLLDVSISGTDSTDDTVHNFTLTYTDYVEAGKDKDNTTVYPVPVFAAITPRGETTDDTEDRIMCMWDPDNNSAANGTTQLDIAHHGTTNDILAGLDVQILLFFEDVMAGVNNGYVTTS